MVRSFGVSNVDDLREVLDHPRGCLRFTTLGATLHVRVNDGSFANVWVAHKDDLGRLLCCLGITRRRRGLELRGIVLACVSGFT